MVLGALRAPTTPARFGAGLAARLVPADLGDPFRRPPRVAARACPVDDRRGTLARGAADRVGVGRTALLLRTGLLEALRVERARGLADRAEDRPARGPADRAEDRCGALRVRAIFRDELPPWDRLPGPAWRSLALAQIIAVIATIPTRKPLFLAFMTDSLTFARLSTFVNSSA